jgi:hypothetical protein
MLFCLCVLTLSVCVFIGFLSCLRVYFSIFPRNVDCYIACVFPRYDNGLVDIDDSRCLVTLPISSMIDLVIQNHSFFCKV